MNLNEVSSELMPLYNVLYYALIPFIIGSIIVILMYVSIWKIFKKANRKGWESLVPVHNIFVLMEISGTPTWHIFLSFIPWVNIYVVFRVCIDLAHKFKKSTGFGIATVFFSIICLPILAFSKKINYDFGETPETEKKEYNQEIVNQQVFAEQTQETQQVNEMPMNYTNNNVYQTNMEMPIYNENINNMKTVMPTPLVQPTYEEPVSVIENTMGVQTPELVIPTQSENLQQGPVYQAQALSQPVTEQPLPNVVQDQTILSEQMNNNPNGTMM